MTTLASPVGEVVAEIPGCNLADPADLEAHFGNFGFFEHLRKIVLANCREIERAKALERTEKVSEARLDDLSRVSDTYVAFIIDNLEGRRRREQNVRDSMTR